MSKVALLKVVQSRSPLGCFLVLLRGQKTCQSLESVLFTFGFNVSLCFSILAGYPSLRIEKNDLRSVTLLEAKVKVKDIAISRERVTLRDVLHEGTRLSYFLFSLFSCFFFLSHEEALEEALKV